MTHLTMAIAILVSNVVLKPLYIAILFAADMTSNGLRFQRLQMLGELLLFLGLAIAWVTVHQTQLTHRLTRPVPGRWAVIFGVWLFFAVLAVTLASRLIPHAVYILGAFPSKYLLNSPFTSPIISAVLLYGIGRAFLATSPKPTANTQSVAPPAP